MYTGVMRRNVENPTIVHESQDDATGANEVCQRARSSHELRFEPGTAANRAVFEPQGHYDSCQRSHGLRFGPGTAANRAVLKPQGHYDSCQRSHELRFEPGTAANRAVFKPHVQDRTD